MLLETLSIPCELGLPVFLPGGGCVRELTAIVTVPEAAVYKDDLATLAED
jgi:hypothetical protein